MFTSSMKLSPDSPPVSLFSLDMLYLFSCIMCSVSSTLFHFFFCLMPPIHLRALKGEKLLQRWLQHSPIPDGAQHGPWANKWAERSSVMYSSSISIASFPYSSWPPYHYYILKYRIKKYTWVMQPKEERVSLGSQFKGTVHSCEKVTDSIRISKWLVTLSLQFLGSHDECCCSIPLLLWIFS